jgi:hypothetical protein
LFDSFGEQPFNVPLRLTAKMPAYMKKILLPLFILSTVFGYSQNNGNYHLDKEFALNETGMITLNCGDAKVVISGSKRKTARIKIDHVIVTKGLAFGSKEFSMEIKQDNGNLALNEHSRSKVGVIGYFSEKYTILLEVPAAVSLTIHGDDGNYQLKNIGGSIAMNLDDADTELTGCYGSRFSFKVGDGNVRIDQGKGMLEIDGDDSDISVKHGAFTEIYASVDDGKLELETSLSESGTYSMRAQDGSVSLNVLNGGGNFTVHHDDGRVTTEGNFKIVEKSDDETRFTLSDGKARVDIRVDDGRVSLVSAKASNN